MIRGTRVVFHRLATVATLRVCGQQGAVFALPVVPWYIVKGGVGRSPHMFSDGSHDGEGNLDCDRRHAGRVDGDGGRPAADRAL